jgi:RNA polymerase sigma factor (sigma-70 family)
MAANPLPSAGSVPLLRRSPRSRLLRFQSDERLIALTRLGNYGAFEVLVGRYRARLLTFSRHMLGSAEDAEDTLQEVFAGAYAAIMADERPINVRPWLYRIARNACLKHVRGARSQRARPPGGIADLVDPAEESHRQGRTTEDEVTLREDVRQLMSDIGELPDTQRTALVLWAMDARSYEETAEVMETSVAGVKSLLVRARLGLAEAAEARELSCEAVELELARAAQGLGRPRKAIRRHIRWCQRCQDVDGRLKQTSKALAAISPAPLVLLAHGLLSKLGLGAAGNGASPAGATAATAATAGAAATTTAGPGAAIAVSTGLGTVAAKAAAGFAAATLLTAGTVEVSHLKGRGDRAVRNTAPSAPAAPRPAGPARPGRADVTARAQGPRRHATSTRPAAETPSPARREAPVSVPRVPQTKAPASTQPVQPQAATPTTSGQTAPADTGAQRGRPEPESGTGIRRGRPAPPETPPDAGTSTSP